jgi:phosphoglycolate phosphatase-like HAD superfamily hydrolase
MWIVSDLDGTLCDQSHRLHHAHAKEWEPFNQKAEFDPCVPAVREVLMVFAEYGYRIALVTARPDNVRTLTDDWLDKHQIPYHTLLMRQFGDWRPDWVVKLEAAGHYGLKPSNVKFVLDDRDTVVSMWRQAGFACFQVAKDNMPGYTP